MPKDTSAVVLDMLSSAGTPTKSAAAASAPAESPPALPPLAPPPPPAPAQAAPSAPRRTRGAVRAEADAPEAPRTLRLRPETAAKLRAAWMAAKRDDVLLTAQDFASDLVDDALAARRRRRTSSAV